ncbi:hypothetical protein [Halorussus salinisoli]|uniref:hypothetical protein n=1 Tax=Halorussus salinisoli TaxID=2558242 RepID=UPI0010C21E81|nr:hypothetical protein [Halorussus salinisoli]
MTQSPPNDSVSSTLRINAAGDKKRPTMDYWAHIAIAVLSGDDGALTRGQVANEAILGDLRDVDAYDGISDNLMTVEQGVLDDLDRMLDIDVRDELLSLSAKYECEVEARWAHYVRKLYEGDGEDDENLVQHPPNYRKEQCNMYLLPDHSPAGRGLGDLVADSLIQLLASPWSSRAERLANLQTLATACREGWDAVDDERMTRFVTWVRDGDTSLFPVGDLADAVDGAINSDEGDPATDDEQDGKIREWDEDETDPRRLANRPIAETQKARTGALEAATRYCVRRGASFTGAAKMGDRKELISTVFGHRTPYLVETYGPVITDTEEAMLSESEEIDVQEAVQAMADEEGVDLTDNPVDVDDLPTTDDMDTVCRHFREVASALRDDDPSDDELTMASRLSHYDPDDEDDELREAIRELTN